MQDPVFRFVIRWLPVTSVSLMCRAFLVFILVSHTVRAEGDLTAVFAARGFDTSRIVLPDHSTAFPVERFKHAQFSTVGRLELVVKQGTNGLEVDPAGEYLYVVRGAVQRYSIRSVNEPIGRRGNSLHIP